VARMGSLPEAPGPSSDAPTAEAPAANDASSVDSGADGEDAELPTAGEDPLEEKPKVSWVG
jgi:hypothetical protein